MAFIISSSIATRSFTFFTCQGPSPLMSCSKTRGAIPIYPIPMDRYPSFTGCDPNVMVEGKIMREYDDLWANFCFLNQSCRDLFYMKVVKR